MSLIIRRKSFTVIILALPAVFLFSGCGCGNDELTWTSIDLNTPTTQADAHFLTANRTNHVLIDAGTRQSAGKLINFLRNKDCRHIQAVIITHGHFDHYGGLAPLINSGITIGAVYFNPPAPLLITREPWGCSEEEISEIHNELQKNNIPLKAIDQATEWVLGKAMSLKTVCAFNGLDTPMGRTDINDTSAVMMLTHHKIKILFAADLNRAIGDYLTTNCPGLLRADILKFPHHGTEGFANDEFFAAVGAGTFIVPAPQELWLSERSARARHLTEGRKVYVNGRDGDITIVSDGKTFRVICGKFELGP